MPTLKQIAVAKDLLENIGKPVSTSMLENGYSPATAKNPLLLTESKGWQELMEEYYPDRDLMEVGKEGLHAMKPIGAMILVKKGENGTETILKENEGMIEVADHQTRHKFLETALKLKGHLQTTKDTFEGKIGDFQFIITRNAS